MWCIATKQLSMTDPLHVNRRYCRCKKGPGLHQACGEKQRRDGTHACTPYSQHSRAQCTIFGSELCCSVELVDFCDETVEIARTLPQRCARWLNSQNCACFTSTLSRRTAFYVGPFLSAAPCLLIQPPIVHAVAPT